MITLAGKVLVRKALMGAIIDDAIDAEALTNALNTIQEQCGLDKFPRTKPPLILLDNLECSRSNLYEELLQNMKIQVEFAIDGLEEKDIIDMLRETIKFIVVKELQSIPILLINKLKTIPTKILHILHSKGILDDMPLNIQQSAWKADRQLFRTKLHTTLSSSKSLNDMLIATVNLIGKEGGLLTELCMFACDALTSSNNNSTISGGNSFVGVNFSLLMRRIFNHLQANSARVPSLGKLFDLAAYIELLCSKKSKESKENACEEDIYEALQQIIHSEMSIRDKDIAATMHRTHGGDVIPAVKTSQRDYESAWQFINKLDVGGVFAHPVSEDVAPGYHRIVKTPMDLGAIKRKIPEYRDLASMDADVRLMFRNCKDFNGPGPYAKMSAQYLREWCRYRDRLSSAPPVIEQPIPAATSQPSKKQKLDKSVSLVPSNLVVVDLTRALADACKLLTELDTSQIFAAPVTEAIAPGYFAVVSKPMDLSTVQLKVNNGVYSSFTEFEDDVRLMFDNCSAYNPPRTPVYKYGITMKKEWEKRRLDFYSKPKTVVPPPPDKIQISQDIPQVPHETVHTIEPPPLPEEVPNQTETLVKPDVLARDGIRLKDYAIETDLHSNFASPKLAWALCMLQDSAVISILKHRFCLLIDAILSECLVSDRFTLFSESKYVRIILQLIQISWKHSTQIEPCDVYILRRGVPHVVLELLRRCDEKTDIDVADAVRLSSVELGGLGEDCEALLTLVGKAVLPTVKRLSLRRTARV